MQNPDSAIEDAPDANVRPLKDSVEKALDQIGDRWSFLILREAYFGVRRFDVIQQNIGASPSILTTRLKKMVADGLLEKKRYLERPPRYEYRLTAKGMALYPAIVLLMQWGDEWLSGDGGPPLRLIHKTCGHAFKAELRCSVCNDLIDARDIRWESISDGGSD